MDERRSDVDAMTPRERDYYLHASIRGYVQFLYTLDYGRRRLMFEARDAQRLAQLLIKETTDFFGGKGGVGGAIRICTINPITGTKCRVRS